MRHPVILTFLISMYSCTSPKQGESEKIEAAVPSSLRHELADSGKTVNGVKVGQWVEYTIDTIQAQTITVVEGDAQREAQLNQTYINVKGEGNYINGLRNGKWFFFSEFTNGRPITWVKKAEIEYAKGEKHGQEIHFSISGDTISVESFINGQEHGLGKLFHPNHQNKIWKVYNTDEGERWLIKEYYPSGSLKASIKEIDKQNRLKLYQGFYENGSLMAEGQIFNDEFKHGIWKTYFGNGKLETEVQYLNNKMDGNYKSYHKNGRLWSERIYRDGKIWEVVSNFDSNGNKKDKGTLKNGTGNIILYDANGEFLTVENYLNGVEK